MVKKALILVGLFIFVFNISSVFAHCGEAHSGNLLRHGYRELGFSTGYLEADLSQKDEYKVVPLMMRLGYDLRPFLNNQSDWMMEFFYEPFMNVVASPDSNVESGVNFMLKFAPAVTASLYPYLEGGVGMIYMTQHTREQSTQFNFTQQIGAGITYFLKDGLAISAGYRYRHLSNASIDSPNRGIDSNSVIFSLSFFY